MPDLEDEFLIKGFIFNFFYLKNLQFIHGSVGIIIYMSKT
jgi:hypothetical protein